MGVDPVPGSMGQMDTGEQVTQNSGFEDEPPLLEELGINFDLIKQKVKSSYGAVLTLIVH